VGAALVGGVEHVDVAGLHAAAVTLTRLADGPHAVAHRAQVDRHVRGVGDQVSIAVEQGAGEVQPLLDVDRIGGVLQGETHLLGHGHEEVVEHLQHHRIGLGPDRAAGRQGLDAVEDQVQVRVDSGAPAGLDHGGAGGLANDGGALDLGADGEGLPVEHRRRPRLPGHADFDGGERLGPPLDAPDPKSGSAPA
jgi:hypothetical protein